VEHQFGDWYLPKLSDIHKIMETDCRHPAVEIVADDREASAGVIPILEAMEEIEIRIQRLTVGDYIVDGILGFERKTLPDFAQSIIDGRLFRQMIALAASSKKGVLILEGTARDLAQVNIRRQALQGALITISLILGIPVLRARDPDETARLMVYAARQMAAAARGMGKRSGYRPKTRKGRQRYILQGLPGIGPELARRLLAEFGSVAAVVTAGESELRRVAGIGPQTAEKIRWAVSEGFASYGTGNDFPI